MFNYSKINPHTRRTSASLILVSPAGKAGDNYNLLMIKRSDATALFFNQSVFPGGLLDTEADESIAWLEYFEQFGVPQPLLRRLVLSSADRPGVLASQGTGCYDRFFKRSKIWSREITLRLTALRECFEEVGILLCRSREELAQLHGDAPAYPFQQQHPHFDREAWQRRVHNKPSDFLELCRELQVVPDLWSLHEWSAWASPAIIKKGHETVFFIVFLNTQPSLLAEPTEVKECLWRTPMQLLELHQQDELWFLPPQIYELRRFLAIQDYHKLLTFAVERSKLGTTMFLPIAYVCTDGTVFVLPGDDLYVPEAHLVTESIEVPYTVAELNARSKRLHRYEGAIGTSAMKVELNQPTLNGHLAPQNWLVKQHKL